MLLQVGADIVKDLVSLYIGEQAHASGGKEKDGSVLDLVIGDVIEGVVDELLEVVGAD